MKELVFRVALLLLIAFAAMAWLGWLTFEQTDDSATIKLNTNEVERTADEAVEAGREFAKETQESIHQATEPEPIEADRE